MNTVTQAEARYTAAQMVEDMTDPMQPCAVIHGQRRDFRSIRLDAKTQAACDAAYRLERNDDRYPLTGGACI